MLKIKTVLIAGGILLVVVVIATAMITTQIVGGSHKEYIKALERNSKDSQKKIMELEKLLTSSAEERIKADKKRDSLILVLNNLNREKVVLNKELNSIKGRYKDISNDSLYSAIIEAYNNSNRNNN